MWALGHRDGDGRREKKRRGGRGKRERDIWDGEEREKERGGGREEIDRDRE